MMPVSEAKEGQSQVAAKPVATTGRALNPLASWLRHWGISLTLLVIVAGTGVPAAYWLGKPAYYTEGVVFVSPRFIKNLETDQEQELQSNSQYREYVQQQVRTINRYDIVEEAMRRLLKQGIKWQKPQETERKAIERLQQRLAVRPVPDTYQITVGLEGESPAGLAEIINTVIAVFLETAKDEEYYASDKRIEILQEERVKLLKEIDEKVIVRTQIAQELGVTTFSETLLNPYDDLLMSNRKALAATQRQHIEAEAAVTALNASNQAALKAQAQEMVAKDQGLSSLKANLNLRKSELLTKMSGLTANHPSRKAAERELAEIDQELQQTAQKLEDSITRMLIEQRNAEVRRALQVETELQRQVSAQSNQASWFTQNYNRALSVGAEIERARKRLNAVDDRISLLILESKAPGFSRLFSSARTPEEPSKGGKRKIFLLFVGAALALAAAVPLAIDWVDPRVRTKAELEQAAGLPVLGQTGNVAEATAHAVTQDCLIRLANRIRTECRARESTVFLLTSFNRRAGTTTLGFQLASHLNNNKTSALVVEANALHPDGGYKPPAGGVSSGLAEWLKNTIGLEEILIPGDDILPDRIPVGGTDGLFHLPCLSDFPDRLESLRSRYRCILLDAPPLPVSADTEALVSMADVVLVIVARDESLFSEVRQGLELLERLNPAAVGLVFTKAKTKNNGATGNSGTEFVTPKTIATTWIGKRLWK
ncbi:MAG: hypothetical protein K1Y36_04050 [Blastocatellia bacterium]|nr:hypothetical protein [Blastocatellia bacterium]